MKIKLTIVLFALLANVSAQPEKEIKTLSSIKKPHIGYFIHPFCQMGNIAGSTSLLPGIGGGVIFNHNFSSGVAWNSL